jgi:hypothetical protein
VGGCDGWLGLMLEAEIDVMPYFISRELIFAAFTLGIAAEPYPMGAGFDATCFECRLPHWCA